MKKPEATKFVAEVILEAYRKGLTDGEERQKSYQELVRKHHTTVAMEIAENIEKSMRKHVEGSSFINIFHIDGIEFELKAKKGVQHGQPQSSKG